MTVSFSAFETSSASVASCTPPWAKSGLPPPLPPKQLHPKLLLKTLIAQGQRRLGHMKPLCCLGDGIAFRNGNHIFQLQ